MTTTRQVVVVGGGITGLTCAWTLVQQSRAAGDPIDVTLLEATDRIGGQLRTERRDGFVVEAGPDGFHRHSPALLRLLAKLDLTGELVASRPVGADLLADGLHPLPRGIVMGVPTDARALRASGLLPVAATVRALLGPRPAPTVWPDDLSMEQFFRECFGAVYTEAIVAPLLGGIHGHPLRALSTRALLPRLYDLARVGADLRGTLKSRRPVTGTGPFLSLRGGLAALPVALANALPATAVRCGWRVASIGRRGSRYVVARADGHPLVVDAVVLAVPAAAAAHVLHARPAFAALLARPPAGAISVQLGFANDALPATHGRSGFLVACRSPGALTGASFSHRKWPHVAPAGGALIRCLLSDRYAQAADAAVVEAARAALGAALGQVGAPDLTLVSRWHDAMRCRPTFRATWPHSRGCAPRSPGTSPASRWWAPRSTASDWSAACNRAAQVPQLIA